MALLALAAGLAGLAGPARCATPVPTPFVATYAVSYRGLSAGKLIFAFEHDPATDTYRYETRAQPSALARLFVSGAALERSVMRIDAQGVRPLEWRLDDGKAGGKKDGALRFDWTGNTVTGVVEGERVQLPTEPGLQDRSSIQVAVTTALLRGAEPGTIPLIDDNRIKRYTYTRKADAVLDTKLGRLDAVIYESTRQGSDRVSRFWMVPSLEYLPARAEQIRKGKVETVMTLIELKSGEHGGTP